MDNGFELPDWVIAQLRRDVPKRFTGNIQINCFEGGVGNFTITWSRKAPDGGHPMTS